MDRSWISVDAGLNSVVSVGHPYISAGLADFPDLDQEPFWIPQKWGESAPQAVRPGLFSRRFHVCGEPGMNDTETLYDRLSRRAKNRPAIAFTLIGVAILIGLGQIAGAFKAIHDLFIRPPVITAGEKAVPPGGAPASSQSQSSRPQNWPKVFAFRAGDDVRSLAFSPSGEKLAIGTKTVSVLWDVKAGVVDKTLAPKCDSQYPSPEKVAFSPDGRLVAVGCNGGMGVFDAGSGGLLKSFPRQSGQVESVSFSPDSGFLASAADDNVVKIWNLKTGGAEMAIDGHPYGFAWQVAFSPDGSRIAIVGTGVKSDIKRKYLAVWQINPKRSAWTQEEDLVGTAASSVAFSPDGKAIAWGDGRELKVFDADDGSLSYSRPGNPQLEPTHPPDLPAFVDSPVFHPAGQLLITAGARTIAWRDAKTGSILQNFLAHPDSINSLAITRDGHWLASGDQSGNIKLWHLQ